MRLGLQLDEETGLEFAAAADRNGLSAVLVPAGSEGTGIALATAVAAVTLDTRIVLTVPLGSENPVTLAEEIAVADNLSGGRIVVLVDTAALTESEAAEDIALLRACWTGRWVSHHGSRWNVPAGIHGAASPAAVAVTPLPAQLEVPVWATGSVARALASGMALPVLAESPGDCPDHVELTRVQPGCADIDGDPDHDRATLSAWVDAGASHLFLRLPADMTTRDVQQHVARLLVPEAMMPNFPRIIAESPWPREWPATDR